MVNFIVLGIMHLLGDFYLQTAKIAKCKNAKIDSACNTCIDCKRDAKLNSKYLFRHIVLYIIPFSILFFMTSYYKAIIIIFVIVISHSIIDALSCFMNKKIKQILVLIIDQLLHVSILFGVCQVVDFYPIFDEYVLVLKTLLVGLLLMAPCSVFINKLFEDLYASENVYKDIFDIGSIIGIFERILVLIFALSEDFAAIAIIITVKTWARTNDLKKPEFSNKYLLGTLASLVLALCCYILFKII